MLNMKTLKKFNKFNEAIKPVASKASKYTGDITLYRLTSHSVVDLAGPGSYYVSSKSSVDPNHLDKKGSDLYLITVKCPSSNIDLDKSEKEIAKLKCPSIVVVKDDKKCDLIKVEPYKSSE